MINAFEIFENATDYDKGLFISALDKHIEDLPRLHDHVSTRVKEREKIMVLKEKFNAGVYGFSYDQLVFFLNSFNYYANSANTNEDLDDSAREMLWMKAKKYSRQIEDVLDEYRK